MHWASSISDIHDCEGALAQAITELRAGLEGPPTFVLCFVSGRTGGEISGIARRLATAFPNAITLGCSMAGVIAGGRELERGRGPSATKPSSTTTPVPSP